jgi:hypothetical protein
VVFAPSLRKTLCPPPFVVNLAPGYTVASPWPLIGGRSGAVSNEFALTLVATDRKTRLISESCPGQ